MFWVSDNKEGIDKQVEKEYGLIKKLHSNNDYSLYLTDAKKFVKKIDKWGLQRPEKKEHVNEIYENICNVIDHDETPNMRTFVVVENKEKLYLIDGQHRVKAMEKLFSERKKLTFEILVEIFSSEDDEAIVDLFKMVNKSLPLEPRHIPDDDAVKLLSIMKKRFGRECFTTQGVRKSYPKMEESILHDLFKQKFIALRESNTSFSIPIIVEKIIQINSKYEKRTNKIPGIRDNENAIKKCQDRGCYLGLNPSLSWVDNVFPNIISGTDKESRD